MLDTHRVRHGRERGDAEGSHILLVGWPSTNGLMARIVSALPVRFGWATVKVAGETFANPQTEIVAAVPNLMAVDRSVVLFDAVLTEVMPSPGFCSSRRASRLEGWPCHRHHPKTPRSSPRVLGLDDKSC